MYAIIESGGKQIKVEPGLVIKVEKLAAAVGDTVTFENVVLVNGAEGMRVGQPFLENAVVSGTVVQQGKGPKLIAFRFKRRKRVRVKQGHRQPFTGVKIDHISL